MVEHVLVVIDHSHIMFSHYSHVLLEVGDESFHVLVFCEVEVGELVSEVAPIEGRLGKPLLA